MRIKGITDNHRAAMALLAGFTLLFLTVMIFVPKLSLPTSISDKITDAFVLFEGALLLCLKTDGGTADNQDPSFRDDVETTPSVPAKE